MNKLEDLQDKFFLDIQNIIQELSEIDSIESLLSSEYLVKELTEKSAFLKLSQYLNFDQELHAPTEKNISGVEKSITVETEELDLEDNQILAEAAQEEFIVESPEYVELIGKDDLSLELSDNEMFKDENVDENYSSNVETLISEIEEVRIEETLISEIVEEESYAIVYENPDNIEDTNPSIEEDLEKTEQDLISEISVTNEAFEEQKESSFSFAFAKPKEEVVVANTDVLDDAITTQNELVNDLTNEDEVPSISEDIISEKSLNPVFEDNRFQEEKNLDKKYKIANIKGVTKSLFDLDSTENESEDDIKTENKGSLVKSNVATNYMEAPKPKPEFRLDLNDKIAFTQKLFNNSQVELNQAVTRLNSYQTLEAAKEYLSDLYYERNWQKADSYAQRLWTLVENRFL